MNNKQIFKNSAFSLVAAITLAGCGTAAHRIEPASQGLVTVGDVNTQDWQDVSTKAINSLLSSGVLVRADGRKTIVMINPVKNSTSSRANTSILTNKIRQSLLRSGKAVTTTAVGGKGPEDNATRQVRELENDDMFNQSTVQKRGTVIAPDMSLSGEIINESVSSGRNKENAFYFHVEMTDLATGLAVWEDTFDISKQETRNIFGY
ncbi:MAG: penicillin-binding protein activator LpoB [Victivallaceae bacterium]|nr:penicillin-binding protein activator LpoB [Victivallaceae bacterium]